MPWPLASKPGAAGRAGGVEAKMAADAASATVKVARRINGSRNISRGISESSSPRISRNNSSISRDIHESSSPRISSNISSGTSNISNRSRNSSTRGISRDISRSSPHSIQGDGVHRAFVSGVVNTGIFSRSAVQYPPRVLLTRTRARELRRIHILKTTPILGAALHNHSQPPPSDLHGLPVPSELSWSSFSEQATLAHIAPPGKFHVPNESMVGDVTVPGSYLHSSFVVQSGSNEDDVWITDSGASCHMTHDRTRMHNTRPSPPGRETITVGDRRRIKVEYIGNMDVIFHGTSDQRIKLINVAYVPDLGFNLYSLHAVQRTHLIVSDASGTHIIGANLTFPRSSSGSYLRAMRLPAGTVGARRRQGDMRATNLLRQLGHPIPPPPQEISLRRNMCATGLLNSNVPGVVTVLEPTPFPPLSSVLGEIQFVGKTPSRPESRIGTPLAAAALTPGPLTYGKEVCINHLYVSLAHAHASVLKATAKQHEIRLTGELVSCSACSRAKGHRAPTPHHATRRANQPLGLVHINTARPYSTSLGGLRYVVMFVDSASRLQRPYGACEKSTAAIFYVVKYLKADMGVPRAFRTDNGTEYSNSMLVNFCNDFGICREFTAPYTPQQNRSVESAIS